MEALFELLIELFIEVFGQIILEALSAGVANFFSYIHTNTKAKKILKTVIAGFIFSATLVLLILALCFKKSLYVEIVIGYFIVLFITYVLKYISRNVWKNHRFEQSVLWINRSIHYAFPIVLIVFAAIYPNKATPILISLSSVALAIYFSINMYRLYFGRKRTYEKFLKKYKKLFHSNQNKSKKRIRLLKFLSKNKDHYITFLQTDATQEDLEFLRKIFKALCDSYNSMLFLEVVDEAQKRLDAFYFEEEITKEKNKLRKKL